MPYKSKEQKTSYQKDYMRRKRANLLDPVRPKPLDPVRPVQPKLEELRQLIKSIEHKDSPKPLTSLDLPLYNPALHGPGDKVLVQRGKRLVPTVIPLLDGDGQPIPSY